MTVSIYFYIFGVKKALCRPKGSTHKALMNQACNLIKIRQGSYQHIMRISGRKHSYSACSSSSNCFLIFACFFLFRYLKHDSTTKTEMVALIKVTTSVAIKKPILSL